MAELAYLNGNFLPIAEARVSIEDRGFQFGDGIYEVLVVYAGRPFLSDRHLARLRSSAGAIGIRGFDARPLDEIVREGLRRSELSDAVVYIQITRGIAPRSHVIANGLVPTVVMTFKPLPQVSEEVRRRGLKVMTTIDNRWANCYIKAITLLPNVLAKNNAVAQGLDDAIFLTADCFIRECTSANVFAVCERSLLLPPRDGSVLHGVTQGFLLECAEGIGVPTIEAPIHVDALRKADEVFLCSTLTEVLGIVEIDGMPVGVGSVGKITGSLFAEFRRRSRA